MTSSDPGFWVTLAGNQEFWKQLPYWATGTTAIAGSLLGAWFGARLNRAAGIRVDRASRRRQNLEQIAELAYTINIRAMHAKAYAQEFRRRIVEEGRPAHDFPAESKELSEYQRKLHEISDFALQGYGILELSDDQTTADLLENLYTESQNLTDFIANLDSTTADELQEQYDVVKRHYAILISNLKTQWSSDTPK